MTDASVGEAPAAEAAQAPETVPAAEPAVELETENEDHFIGCETLVKDLTVAMLDRLKWMPKVWSLMTVEEQRDTIAAVTKAVEYFAKRAVKIIAEDDRPTFEAKVEQATLKDGLKLTLVASRSDDNVVAMNRALGKEVLVGVADADVHMDEAYEVKPDATSNQEELDVNQKAGGEEPKLPLDDKPVFDSTRAGQG